MIHRPSILGINLGGGWREPGTVGRPAKTTPAPRPHEQLINEIGDFLLTDEDVAQIDFRLGRVSERIHITGSKLQSVGLRLKTDKLKFEINDVKLEKAKAGATFERGDKLFTFRTGVMFSAEELANMPELMARGIGDSLFRGDALTSGLVVHEAVHAALEHEDRAIIRLSEESAAYISECLFHVYRDTIDFRLENSEAGKDILNTAHGLIVQHRLDKEPGKHLTFSQYRPLRQVIRANPLYDHLGPLERQPK